MSYKINELAHILECKSTLVAPENTISTLLTDSRSLTNAKESLFFAIVTDRNDGHRYIADLYNQGVRNFVVSNTDIINGLNMPDANIIDVPDTTDALQRLAATHRQRFDIPVIGITGSRGKTTVKEWLFQLLHSQYDIERSPRSYNSQIGVPLSLWQISEHTQLAIIEAGISQTNEMTRLEHMIRPSIGIITNIGADHQNGFSSLHRKCIEKLQLMSRCDCVIYNGDDTLISDTMREISIVTKEIAWSRKNPEKPLFISSIIPGKANTEINFTYLGFTGNITIPFTRDSDIENAISCLAVMLYLNVPLATISERMQKLSPVATRMEVKDGMSGSTIIYDTYQADIPSLSPALDFMDRHTVEGLSRTIILSDLYYQDMTAADAYAAVAQILNAKNISRVVGIGKEIVNYKHLFPLGSAFYHDTADFIAHFSPNDFAYEQILIKGNPEFHFERVSAIMEQKQYETILDVNLDSVLHNYNFFRKFIKPQTKMVCMVKASGYGAGSPELAKTLQSAGAAYLAVAVVDEGVDLRKAGVTMPIMVLNPNISNYKMLFSYHLEPEIYSIAVLKDFIREADRYGFSHYPVHIKLDTGMHRLGFIEEELEELISVIKAQKAVCIQSIFSHLAGSEDEKFDDYTMEQISIFTHNSDIIRNAFPNTHILRHILNSTGIIRFPQYQFDMVRLGIGLYGVETLPNGMESELKAISSLHTAILQLRHWSAGSTIGYGRKGLLTRDSVIATIPVGYADGINRHLGCGGASFYVGDHMAPTVGNICMDTCMIDVTDVPNVHVGDPVEIFGEHIPVQQIADALGTIPYEVLTSVSARVKRVYFRE